MPPKKSQKAAAKGPFFFFSLEFKRKEEAAGYRFTGGMPEVIKRAGPHWEKLAPYQREPYNLQAKKYKAHPTDLLGERYTTQGIAFSQVENVAQANRSKEDEIQKQIVDMIQEAVTANALEELEVIFISCNYFCVTTANNYVAAELAMIKYSMSQGIIDRMHILINPQELPLGMAHDAELHACETHQLPLPPDAIGETDYEKVMKQVFKFSGGSLSKKKLPILFTYNKDRAMVKNILLGFLEETGIENLEPRIYPLIDYFYHLKRATESYGLDINSFPSVHMAKALLEKDVYAYTTGIGCEVHEKLACPVVCALSKCTRWAYTISDCCCLDLGIEMEGGKHLPENMTLLSDVTDTISYISSRMSKTTINTDHTRIGKFRRPRSSERGPNDTDQTNTTIYSSRAVQQPIVSKDPREYPSINETFNTTNPFLNFKSDETIKKITKPKSTAALPKTNPWSRENKLIESRVPKEEAKIAVVGRGRGTLAKLSGGRGMSLDVISSVKSVGRGHLNL